jgi:hypothetical protein
MKSFRKRGVTIKESMQVLFEICVPVPRCSNDMDPALSANEENLKRCQDASQIFDVPTAVKKHKIAKIEIACKLATSKMQDRLASTSSLSDRVLEEINDMVFYTTTVNDLKRTPLGDTKDY